MDVDVDIEVLNRLPVRSLLRFKCVSKLWMTLISDPNFKMKHLNHAKNDENSQKILVNQQYPYIEEFSLYCSSLSSVQQVEHPHKFDCPSNIKSWHHTLYCCYHGLALIGFYNYKLDFLPLLWNPSTRESIVLPPPKILPNDYCTWGLGYDSASDDYMILKIDEKSRSESLALKSGSWRLMDKHPICDVHPMLTSTDSLVFVHGAFHWLINSLRKYYVVSFGISDEVYREIPLPEQIYLKKFREPGVSVLGGMLCAYSHYVSRIEDVFMFWVMKDYVSESWTELYTIQGTDLKSAIPKYMFSDGEVLLCCRHLRRCYYEFRPSKGPFGVWPQSNVILKGV
ncbi:F-box/kelch-repeat protein At3g06240-like [Solanum tuberosum]|uniref:F-box family protein n=1 Tax=Solanum tuberosum TaxID=4113 RepID=M1DKY6_SOLTU|nr:PREDICTED: F-box/kelch-repeat protein At3g06240-like [Solanum tuberosum]